MAELAACQHGVVERSQLLALGLSRHAINHMLACGRLHRLYRGVYAVGHAAVTPDGRLMAAVLASKPAAVLSHRSAAGLWGIAPPASTLTDLTSPGRGHARRGIRLHTAHIPPDERTFHRDIPVTTVPRTLLDLAAVARRPRELERAIEQAEVLRLHDPLSLPDLLARYPRRPGTSLLRTVMAAMQPGATLTRSELEELFLAFLDALGLPRPFMNATIELRGRLIEVDCLWRECRVIAEIDGVAPHSGRRFYTDRTRDRHLRVDRWTVIRITAYDLEHDRAGLAADLRALLG